MPERCRILDKATRFRVRPQVLSRIHDRSYSAVSTSYHTVSNVHVLELGTTVRLLRCAKSVSHLPPMTGADPGERD